LMYSTLLRQWRTSNRPFFRLRHFTDVAFSAKLPTMSFPTEIGHTIPFALYQRSRWSQARKRSLISRMKSPTLFFVLLAAITVRGDELDTMGISALRQVTPGLQGNGIPVAQAEGAENNVVGEFEVDPASASQPISLFNWISINGTTNMYPNNVGTMSFHAGGVAAHFYGVSGGVAPQVSHVDNYDADYFFNHYIDGALQISARLANQSFIFANPDGSHLPTNEEQSIDLSYDDYAVQYGVLFVSGAGNGGPVFPSATCYNGIGVGVYPGSSSFGPTSDGRSKPDLVAPGGITSFSTPYVCGSTALLLQAAVRGDGGANTNAASDNRTLKALLLNGAIKPADWTNGITSPLDARYGAGVLNVFNSWNELRGSNHSFIESTSVATGGPHPPGGNAGNETALCGWDLNSLTNADSSHDRINHYYFNLPGSNSFTLTTTITWLRPHSSLSKPMPGINDLNLFLYNTATGDLILSSTSAVDNVEHIYIPVLPPGRYDLQVEKNAQSQVSPGETYALAFEFFNVPLSIVQTNANLVISWPLAPAGFQLQSAADLNSTWSTVAATAVVNTNTYQNVVTIPVPTGNQFFRLQRP
jgi:hypothetical protein